MKKKAIVALFVLMFAFSFVNKAQIVVLQNISCNGYANGELTVVPNFGTGPYTYLWSNSDITPTITNLVAGLYSVTVTDALLATTVYTETLIDPPLLTIALSSQVDVLCNGMSTGSLDITVAGGTGAYGYDWNNGAVSEDIVNVFAGNYTVIATDANGCIATANFTITEPALPLQTTLNSTNVLCNGGNDGTTTANAVGGTGILTYLWSTGDVTPSINNLVAGIYSVTVTDANGCTATNSITINEPISPIQATLVQTDVSCFGGNDGTVMVTNASGGTGSLAYLWSTGAITSEISNLIAGIYSVTVTDANACTFVGSVTINEPTVLTVTLTSQTDVVCKGSSTGSIDVTVVGGMFPYFFQWVRNGFPYTNMQNIASAPAGIYVLTVNDMNGCVAILNSTITEPATTVSVSIVSTNVTCNSGNNGSATANAVGGTGGYTYLWDTGDATQAIVSLAAGNYSVTVTDVNGCIDIANCTITEPQYPIEITLASTDVLCFGYGTGSINIVDVSGENGPLTYLWSDGTTDPNITNQVAGNYSVTVTDANLCTATANSIITEPAQIVIVPTITPSSCDGQNDGAIALVIGGGISPYTFSWQEVNFDSTYTSQNLVNVRGGTYALMITDANGCIYLDTLTITNLVTIPVNVVPTSYVCNGEVGSVSMNAIAADSAYYFTYSWSSMYNTGSFTTNDSVFTTSTSFLAGDYTITLTDNNTGCATYFDFTIDQSTTPLVVMPNIQHNLCYEDATGSITLQVTGGDPLPAYQCNWTGPNGFSSTAFSIGGLAVGDYTYTVSDDGACSVTETIRIEPLIPLQGYVISENVLCNGDDNGQIEAFYSGGTGPLTYLWSNSATTQFITGLSIGTYTLVVTDSVGCSITSSAIITQPALITIALDSLHNIQCYDGTDGGIWLTTAGGNSTLEYNWLHDGILFPQVTEDIIDVPAGDYQVTVMDSVGCSAQMSFTLTQPAQTLFTETISTISCNNGADGYWQIMPVGLDTPYVAIFSTGDTISTDTVPAPSIGGLSTGNYYVTFTSILGCAWTFNLFLEQPLPITVGIVDIVPVICKDASTGSIVLDNVHGGTSPYTFLWDNGMTTQTITNVPANMYNITITDALDCNIYETYEVEEPFEEIKFFADVQTTSCQQSEDGEIVVYTENIYWSPYTNTFYLYDSLNVLVDSVSPGQIIGDLTPGLYIGIIINEYGCTAIDSLYVNKGPDDCIIIPNLVTVNGDGYNDVFEVQGGCEYDDFLVKIFTDQGVQVFESSDCLFTWDPLENKAAANTVYYYYISVTENSKPYEFKSSININK
ncbi:gliding motility-associated C-terminal domain-containing protein [Patescibacteria group bacterium]|nr:gliding motility-associated C-terminal domain-containing protein [Patescibacteria group bacterium]